MSKVSKIRDFVEQCQLTNAMIEYPINTLVWARIPEKYRDTELDVYQVQILSHDSETRKYTVSYKDKNFEIKYEDVIASQSQLDQMPITDSTLLYKVDRDATDEIVAAAVALNPAATNEDIQNLVSRIGTMDEGEVTISLSSREEDGKITVPTTDAFFVIEQETKQPTN